MLFYPLCFVGSFAPFLLGSPFTIFSGFGDYGSRCCRSFRCLIWLIVLLAFAVGIFIFDGCFLDWLFLFSSSLNWFVMGHLNFAFQSVNFANSDWGGDAAVIPCAMVT